MNEPIINPFLIYWIDVIGNIRVTLFIAMILCMLAAIGFLMEYEENKYRDKAKNYPRRAKCLFVAGCIFGLLLIFIPSRNVVISMLVAQNITKNNIAATVESVEELTERITAAITRGIKNGK